MKNNEKVSIILPVYNSEKYIEETILSILKQSYSNFELIIIDDCSKDTSFAICEKLRKYDNRIVLIKNYNNVGVSESRNIGISKAKGKYIMFVDSDDTLHKNMIEKMIIGINSSELVVCSFKKKIKDKFLSKNIKKMDVHKLEDKISFLQRNELFYVVWNKLYLKRIIYDNLIKFDKKISIAEDFKFNLEYMKYINDISYIDEELYIYRILNNGLNSQINNKKIAIKKELYYMEKDIFFEKGLDNTKINFEYLKICLSELKKTNGFKYSDLKKMLNNKERYNEINKIKKDSITAYILGNILNSYICLCILAYFINLI